MTIAQDLEAQILRYYHAEKWRVGTIARQLGLHHGTVPRVLAQAGRAATMLAAPGLVLLATRGRRGARAAALLTVVPPVVEWWRTRPGLDLPRWVVASVADDVAYGAGVWTGCLRARSFGPLLPRSGRGAGES